MSLKSAMLVRPHEFQKTILGQSILLRALVLLSGREPRGVVGASRLGGERSLKTAPLFFGCWASQAVESVEAFGPSGRHSEAGGLVAYRGEDVIHRETVMRNILGVFS